MSPSISASLFLACLMGCVISMEAILIRRELTPQDFPGAVCNDGQPAVYYHTLERPTSRDFLVYLQGGYFCDSVERCEERCRNEPFYCTANRDVTLKVPGIISDEPESNHVFKSYYKAYVQYCTSDFYIGDGAPTTENGGYYFKGRAHVTAVINSLKSLVGLASGDTLVISGTSAGGRGVAFNCEYIATLVPGVDVRCVVDAAMFYPNWNQSPFFKVCRSFNDIMSDSNKFFNGTLGAFDVNTWWKTFPLPLFIGFELFDYYAYMYFCIDENRPDHLQTWADGMKQVALSLIENAPHVGLYLPGCYGHAMLRKDRWVNKVRVGTHGLTYSETIANWLEGKGHIHAWDDCTGRVSDCISMCYDDESLSPYHSNMELF